MYLWYLLYLLASVSSDFFGKKRFLFLLPILSSCPEQEYYVLCVEEAKNLLGTGTAVPVVETA